MAKTGTGGLSVLRENLFGSGHRVSFTLFRKSCKLVVTTFSRLPYRCSPRQHLVSTPVVCVFCSRKGFAHGGPVTSSLCLHKCYFDTRLTLCLIWFHLIVLLRGGQFYDFCPTRIVQLMPVYLLVL